MVQYELSCYEIGGNEPVDLIQPQQILDADAILLVFSLASPDAIQQLRFYQARLAQIAPDVPMFLVGTKMDTGGPEVGQLLATQIEDIARNWGTRGFWIVSVRAGLNTQGLLASIITLPRSAGKTALKIVFAGPAGGGKTALIAKLANVELTGIYTPTSRSRIITVRLDALAPTPLGVEDTENLPANGEELRQQPVVVEKLPVIKFDPTRGVAPPVAMNKAPPSVMDKAIPSAPVLKDEMSQQLDRLKTIQRDLPPLPPSGPGGPPAVSEGIPLADGTAPVQQSPEMQQPIEMGTKGSSSAPSAALAGGASRPAPMKGRDGAFAETDQKRSEAAPARPPPHAFSQPPTPPLLPTASEEADHRYREDENFSKKKVKRKEAAKAEKNSGEKVAADDSEEITTEMETEAGEKIEKKTAAPDRTVTVERVLERKTTVFYRKQMNPLTRNKLSVVLSTLKIFEQLKLQTVVPADRVGGEQTLKIRELSPFIQVQPIFPGCICVPAEIPLDARKDSDTADFHITPLATGPIMDACVRIYYEGKLVDTIQTPTKVVNQTPAKISVLAAVFFPIFGPLFDERIGPFLASVIPFWEQIGGIENFFLVLAGALGFISTILYYIHRPKQAMPIEANFPELQQFLEEEVKRPALADVLKEKGELEKQDS